MLPALHPKSSYTTCNRKKKKWIR